LGISFAIIKETQERLFSHREQSVAIWVQFQNLKPNCRAKEVRNDRKSVVISSKSYDSGYASSRKKGWQ